MVAWNVKKIERPILFLREHPGWHDISDICIECRMTRAEVSLALAHKPVERKSIQYRETVIGAFGFLENSGKVYSTAYRAITNV